jgi:ABC-type transport system involved in multi-copper enzyme maturation permease subunit
MKWLYWKEWRQNRVVIIALAVLLVVPYVLGFLGIAIEMRGPNRDANFARQVLLGTCLYSFALSQLALALFGGNAVAGERFDRSAEFQAYLPLSRKKILGGKLLMALTVFAIVWIINPIVIACLRRPDMPNGIDKDAPWIVLFCGIAGLLFFGISWLFSSFMTSPTYSAAAGIVSPLILSGIYAYVMTLLSENRVSHYAEAVTAITFLVLSVLIAIGGFLVGNWLYLRRVEP